MDAYLGLCRSREEISMLKEEASHISAYYESRKASISTVLASIDEGDLFSRGARAMLHQLLCYNERLLKQADDTKQLLNRGVEIVLSDSDDCSSDSDDDLL